MIRPRFWRTVLAIALGVLLGVYVAAWLDGQGNTPEALQLPCPQVVTPFAFPVEWDGTARSQTQKPVDALVLKGQRLKASVHAASVALAAGRTRYRPLPLTPGVTRHLTKAQICATAWGKDRRHVTLAMRKHVFAAYGIPYAEHAKYEVDHLIPRELGGADDERNLWPQSWTGPFNAHDKDRLENRLRVLVCAGSIAIRLAQDSIASDWVSSYRLYVAPAK